jgi:G3E family GTPase
VPELHKHEHEHDHEHGLGHSILDSIKSVYVQLDDPLSREKMEFLIGEMLWEGAERGIEVMRCKGVYHDLDTGKTLMLQGVQEKFEFREVPSAEN